jgi:hypothetical protein
LGGDSIESVGCDLQPFGTNDVELVSLNVVSWNQVAPWLRQVEGLQRAV